MGQALALQNQGWVEGLPDTFSRRSDESGDPFRKIALHRIIADTAIGPVLYQMTMGGNVVQASLFVEKGLAAQRTITVHRRFNLN
jgi:hypothetical protein